MSKRFFGIRAMIHAMRRLVIFLLIFAFLATGGYAWFLLRSTPQTQLAKALTAMAQETSFQHVQASLLWDASNDGGKTFSTARWLSLSGDIDAADLTHPEFWGTIGYSATARGEDFQTADAVLTRDRLAFALRDAGPEFSDWVERASASSSDAWVLMDRDVLLRKNSLEDWIAVGGPKDLRDAVLSADIGSWPEVLSAIETKDGGVSQVEVSFHLRRDDVLRGLLMARSAWHLKQPNGAEIAEAGQWAEGVSRGTWKAQIDARTSRIRTLEGSWPVVNAAGNTTGRIKIHLAFGGYGGSVNPSVPEQAIDITDAIRPPDAGGFAPAQNRDMAPEEVPLSSDASSTEDAGE